MDTNSAKQVVKIIDVMIKHRVKIVSITGEVSFYVFGLAEEEWQIEAVKNELEMRRILDK
jgi:hypothetical protein